MDNTFANIEYHQPIGFTTEASTLSINFSNALDSFKGTSMYISQTIEEKKFRKFIELKNQWLEETQYESSSSKIISNAAYMSIIDEGLITIPWILRELKKSDAHWFYALETITGSNPIKVENIGIVDLMKQDWIDWATNNNYE